MLMSFGMGFFGVNFVDESRIAGSAYMNFIPKKPMIYGQYNY